MTYLIKIKTEFGSSSYSAIGDRDALMDAAYNAGALGVTVMVLS
jgi:hypothetical protein